MWLTISILLTAWAAPSSSAEEAATQQDQWFEDGWLGNYSPTPAEDSYVTAGATGKGGFHNVGGSFLLSSVLGIANAAQKKTLKFGFLIQHIEVNIDPDCKCSKQATWPGIDRRT